MSESLYGPMCDALTNAFGAPFEYWHTGGGCTAIIGRLESDIEVIITDTPQSPNGKEAEITDMPTRRALGESTVGYAIGVGREDGAQLAYQDYPTATVDDLPRIVSEQLDNARRGAQVAVMAMPGERWTVLSGIEAESLGHFDDEADEMARAADQAGIERDGFRSPVIALFDPLHRYEPGCSTNSHMDWAERYISHNRVTADGVEYTERERVHIDCYHNLPGTL